MSVPNWHHKLSDAVEAAKNDDATEEDLQNVFTDCIDEHYPVDED